jgi:hypothetical protein
MHHRAAAQVEKVLAHAPMQSKTNCQRRSITIASIASSSETPL